MIGIDVETTGLTPETGRLSLFQAAAWGRETILIDAFACDPSPFLDVLDGCGERIVAHNANFEELWLREYGRDFHLDDTMVMSRVLYGGTEEAKKTRHSLADVVDRELGVELAKDEQTSDWSRRPLTHEQLEYALRVYALENRVRPAVDAMERRGVAMHRGKLEQLIENYTALATRLTSELAEDWGINPGSSKQLRER